MGLYPISMLELMPTSGASQLSSGKKGGFLKSYAIETFTRRGEELPSVARSVSGHLRVRQRQSNRQRRSEFH